MFFVRDLGFGLGIGSYCDSKDYNLDFNLSFEGLWVYDFIYI